MPFRNPETYHLTIAQADFLEDTDVASGLEWTKKDFNRNIRKIGIVGSTNPNDTGVKVQIAGKQVAEFPITTGGANVVPKRDDFKYPNLTCKANQLIQLIASADAVAQDVVIDIVIAEYYTKRKKKTGSSNRRFVPRR